MSQHIVYAVTRAAVGHKFYRVSDPLTWGAAQDRWNELDNARIAANFANTQDADRVLVAGVPIHFLAVRSADDPDWPADGIQFHVLQRVSAHGVEPFYFIH